MDAVYSFVADGDAIFETQTEIFLTTLLGAGVRPAQVVAHCTPNASPSCRDRIASFGVAILPLAPFLDGRYCNKIAQLSALLDRSANVFVLCDTDLAFVAPIDCLFGSGRVRAKPVDGANPPIDMLDRLRRALGIAGVPRVVLTSLDRQPTYSVNCNGGLYIIPSGLARGIAERWRHCAQLVYARRQMFSLWDMHVDQVAFAMAMLSLDLDVEEIAIEYNFPTHMPEYLADRTFARPHVLHYHSRLERSGLLIPTGNGAVDEAVAIVNRVLGDRAAAG